MQGSYSIDSTCNRATTSWYSEVNVYNFNTTRPYTDNWIPTKMVGHFTQVRPAGQEGRAGGGCGGDCRRRCRCRRDAMQVSAALACCANAHASRLLLGFAPRQPKGPGQPRVHTRTTTPGSTACATRGQGRECGLGVGGRLGVQMLHASLLLSRASAASAAWADLAVAAAHVCRHHPGNRRLGCRSCCSRPHPPPLPPLKHPSTLYL